MSIFLFRCVTTFAKLLTMAKKKSKVLKSLRISLTQGKGLYASCEEAGITYPTLWGWRDRSDRIDRYMNRILYVRTELVEDALYKSAMGGSNTAQLFWLKNRGKGWREDPLIDQSQHTHYEFKWKSKEDDRDRLRPSRMPADSTLRSNKV